MLFNRLSLIGPVAALPMGPCSAADSSPATPAKPGWVLAWHDEFEGARLDPTKWDYRYLGPRESSLVSKDSVSLDGQGHLLLTVTEQDGKLLNGMIGNQKKFSTTYGPFKARIKFPRMQGQHGNLSLFTADWEKERLDRSKLPDSMMVDWVRMWKKK